MHLLGISGSLRKNSFNTAALRACQGLLPEGVTLSIFDIAPIPLYNEEVYAKGFPPAVEDFRQQIAAADAIVFATPEYNYSIPGVLKNAIDWASRPPEQPFENKPIALIGATPGGLGTSRSQYHLRQVFIYLNGLLMNRPEVMISSAPSKFDSHGQLIDAATSAQLSKMLSALVAWTRRLALQP